MSKNVFVDTHERFDIVEDCKNFFTKIEEFKLYLVEFEKNRRIKPKIYPFNCVVKRD